MGFGAFGFLDESRILANSGDGIKALQQIWKLWNIITPSWVFVCYGTNDLGIYASPEDYVKNFRGADAGA